MCVIAGSQLTYQGHAGIGRLVPVLPRELPGYTPPAPHIPGYSTPSKTPQNVDTTDGEPQLILPKKIRGTPTIYADLQFPKSSNYGSMKRKLRKTVVTPPAEKTDYAKIKFSPKVAERADL